MMGGRGGGVVTFQCPLPPPLPSSILQFTAGGAAPLDKRAAAVLAAWRPGEEGGNALWDLLRARCRPRGGWRSSGPFLSAACAWGRGRLPHQVLGPGERTGGAASRHGRGMQDPPLPLRCLRAARAGRSARPSLPTTPSASAWITSP